MTAYDDEIYIHLVDIVNEATVVDAHTHIQDDLPDFSEKSVDQKLAGTQASYNQPSEDVIQRALANGCFVRRTMTDPTHALFYSWFAEIVEGANGKLDECISLLGCNSKRDRIKAGRFLLEQLRDSRYSEYAEWLRIMFRLYDGVLEDKDPLNPATFDELWEAVAAQRHNPDFACDILKKHKVLAYVTSIENRAKIPLGTPVHPGDVDLSDYVHPEAWSMFDFNGLLWPERATDFGLFTQGHKFEAERYIFHLEEYFENEIGSAKKLQDEVYSFIRRIIRSPKYNPNSRVLYVDGFQSDTWRFSAPYSRATVDYAIRHHKEQLEGNYRLQTMSCVAEAMLQALNDIGLEYKDSGERFGCCLQLAGGARHFMDWEREVQSIPVNIPNLAQDEYPVWTKYPHIHFEYICAHESLYCDLANAAKQVGNVSVGPWWHFFRRHKIAQMIQDQISMGPISSIACGFTDARYVEMMVAKHRSLRIAIADALHGFIRDPNSALFNKFDAAAELVQDLLLTNPASVHHIPITSFYSSD